MWLGFQSGNQDNPALDGNEWDYVLGRCFTETTPTFFFSAEQDHN